tara:strand:- start:750 stop:1940 length:1191 start_codon:yes stop_codon:yes gene_type:complete
MFQKIKITDMVTILVLVFTTLIGIYYYTNSLARNKLWLKTYPIRAELSVRQIDCSSDSPLWLRNILTYQTRNNNAPANQIAYIEPNGRLHNCESGYVGKYPLFSIAVTEQTRFRYASVTKLWTADTILQLIKDGKLSLDTPLSDIVSEIDMPMDNRIDDITIGQLLSHRAGFDRYSVFGQDMFGIGKDICPNNLLALNEIELGFTPNTKTSYSNLGYCLLGEVISRLNEGKSYKEVIKKQYNFADSGIQFVPNSALPDEVSYNYVETGLTGYADIYTAFDYEGLASAAGLSGNAIDLAKQIRLMAVKPAPNITSLDNDVVCNSGDVTEECYGYAMLPYQPNSQSATVYYRDGSLLGLSTLVAIDERGSVVTLLSNGTPDTGVDHNVKMKIYEYLNR